MQAITTGVRSFPCSQAINQYLRVKYDPTYGLALAGAGDEEIGTTMQNFVITGLGSSKVCPVVLVSAEGTVYMTASGAIAVNGDVYADANGMVAGTGTIRLGKNVSSFAAVNSGDIIEVLRYQSTLSTVAGTTASSFTVDSDATYPNIALASQSGGTGDFTLTLKPAATLTGNRTVLVPDASDTVVLLVTAQELTNKTLTAAVIKTGCTASGSAANDFSGSTGAFKTSTGLNTWGGNTQCVVGPAVTAAGSTQGNATALNEGDVTLVIGVTGQSGYGVVFPSASFAGKRVVVINTTAYACKLYPYSTENIGAGASTAVTLTASHAFLVVFTSAGVGKVYDMGAAVTS